MMFRSYGTPITLLSFISDGLKSVVTICAIPMGLAGKSHRLGSYCRDGIYSIRKKNESHKPIESHRPGAFGWGCIKVCRKNIQTKFHSFFALQEPFTLFRIQKQCLFEKIQVFLSVLTGLFKNNLNDKNAVHALK